MLPNFGKVKAWMMTPTDILNERLPAPPSTSSAQMQQEVAEVRETVANLDRDQQAIAYKWNDGAGTVTPPGHWNAIAAEHISAAGWSEVRASRALALVNMTMHDAAVGCWDTKFAYFNPRRVILFGSHARGDARPDSDHDLLVIVDDDTPGKGTIPDPRRFVTIEACGELRNATLSFSINVDGQWISSDRGADYFIARDGCFRAAIPAPRAITAQDIRGLRAHAHRRPSKDQQSTPAGPLRLTRINKVFTYDRDYQPVASLVSWTGSIELQPGGAAVELPYKFVEPTK